MSFGIQANGIYTAQYSCSILYGHSLVLVRHMGTGGCKFFLLTPRSPSEHPPPPTRPLRPILFPFSSFSLSSFSFPFPLMRLMAWGREEKRGAKEEEEEREEEELSLVRRDLSSSSSSPRSTKPRKQNKEASILPAAAQTNRFPHFSFSFPVNLPPSPPPPSQKHKR